MSIIGDRRNKEAEEKKAKEKELLKVSINKEDVDIIVSFLIYLIQYLYISTRMYSFICLDL